MSDPSKDCKLLFDKNDGHFFERAKERSYSGPDYREFLIKGTKQPESKKKNGEQDFIVEFSGWVIKCKLRRCNIAMESIYKK